jgi:hypothetical protein
VVANDVGVQTNCMSCHAMASYVQGGKTPLDGVLYTGDRYVDLQGPQFSGHLKTDFLWSIPDVALFGPDRRRRESPGEPPGLSRRAARRLQILSVNGLANSPTRCSGCA